MSVAGQVFLEFLLLMALFVIFLAGIAKNIPVTFSKATPYLGQKVQAQVQTGKGFYNNWSVPNKSLGGVKDDYN